MFKKLNLSQINLFIAVERVSLLRINFGDPSCDGLTFVEQICEPVVNISEETACVLGVLKFHFKQSSIESIRFYGSTQICTVKVRYFKICVRTQLAVSA